MKPISPKKHRAGPPLSTLGPFRVPEPQNPKAPKSSPSSEKPNARQEVKFLALDEADRMLDMGR